MELSKNPEKKAFACQMLAERAAALGRLPTRADFSETDIVFIKAHLGYGGGLSDYVYYFCSKRICKYRKEQCA